MVRTDKTLDIKGLAGPRAEIITGKTLDGMSQGEVLTVITTDRGLRDKLHALCRTLGSTVIGLSEDGGTLHIQIRR